MLNRFKIFETDEFIKKLNNLDHLEKNRFDSKSKNYIYPQLRQNPYYGKNIKKLVNWKPETWRYRLGVFRIFYEIDKKEKIVYILTLKHRKNSY